MPDQMKHLNYLRAIADMDIDVLFAKEETYKGSWKKRGGVGVFMMLARKWDRLENMCEGYSYDIFYAVKGEYGGEDGTILAEVRDLRRYLMLVEAEILARVKKKLLPKDCFHLDGTPKEDSNRHAADTNVPAREQLEEADGATEPERSVPRFD